MKTLSQRLRPFQQVRDDGLYPRDVPLPDDQDCDRRLLAVAEVLCRLPNKAYQRMKRLKASKRRSFDWFVPHLGTQGLVYPFLPNVRPRKHAMLWERFSMSISIPFARIIYLSPFLELCASDNLVYVVAHELAHVYLNHAMYYFDSEGEKAEREVYRRVCAWGFQCEAERIEGLRERNASVLTDPATVCLPEEAVQLLRLVRAAGIGMGACYPDDQQLCFEFHSSGDIELFFKVTRCSYRVAVERYNDGDDIDPSFRVMLLAFIPTAALSGLIQRFGEYVAELARSPKAGK